MDGRTGRCEARPQLSLGAVAAGSSPPAGPGGSLSRPLGLHRPPLTVSLAEVARKARWVEAVRTSPTHAVQLTRRCPEAAEGEGETPDAGAGPGDACLSVLGQASNPGPQGAASGTGDPQHSQSGLPHSKGGVRPARSATSRVMCVRESVITVVTVFASTLWAAWCPH